MSQIDVRAFYRFVALPEFAALRHPLRDLCLANGVRGTILLAPEGINGTLAGSPGNIDSVMAGLAAVPAFAGLESRLSHAEEMPFRRLKVRLKKEIVTMGVKGTDPTAAVGRYVAPQDWNRLIADPDVIVIDTRNSFEFAAGSFRGAIDPQTRSFGEFPAFVERQLAGAEGRTIAMFCTGGIRCEKATSYMVSRGFKNVHHLKGGILAYLAAIPQGESLWQGGCFVFDERVALGHGLVALNEMPET